MTRDQALRFLGLDRDATIPEIEEAARAEYRVWSGRVNAPSPAVRDGVRRHLGDLRLAERILLGDRRHRTPFRVHHRDRSPKPRPGPEENRRGSAIVTCPSCGSGNRPGTSRPCWLCHGALPHQRTAAGASPGGAAVDPRAGRADAAPARPLSGTRVLQCALALVACLAFVGWLAGWGRSTSRGSEGVQAVGDEIMARPAVQIGRVGLLSSDSEVGSATWVCAELRATNLLSTPLRLSYRDFVLRDGTGRQFAATPTNPRSLAPLSAMVPSGGTASGHACFPTFGQRGSFTLEFQPGNVITERWAITT